MRAEVHLAWGTPEIVVGMVLSREGRAYLEYAPDWPDRAIALEPFFPPAPGVIELPLSRTRIPLGMLGDAIPDGWGLKVLHARARATGRDPASLTPAEILCLVGRNGPGALTYHPEMDAGNGAESVDLERLFHEADRLYRGSIEEVAATSLRAAGPSGGVRPKVLIDVPPNGQALAGATTPIPGATSYLIKFPTADEGRDMGRVELAYADMARAAGVTTTPTRAFPLKSGKLVCFGAERFDRPATGPRPHVASLAGLVRADFRDAFTTYEEYLKVVYGLTHSVPALQEGYRRMVFNVLASVRDDHMKNFGFLLPAHGEWQLAPAYDLVPLTTRAHATTVDGQELEITRHHTRAAMATVTHISTRTLSAIETEVIEAVNRWPAFAKQHAVPSRRIQSLQRALAGLRRVYVA